MAICSKKCSLCCTMLSGWGVIQLAVMGILFYFRAVAFAEDLKLEIGPETTEESFMHEVDEKYSATANNCWAAALIYLITFLISLQQFYSAKK